MSVFKEKNAIASVEFKKFKGIDRTAPPGDESSAYDMSNLRVLPDGSLQKREGFIPVKVNANNIRAVWSGTLTNRPFAFAVYGDNVYRITLNQSFKNVLILGKIGTSSGKANFIFFNNRLYLYDDDSFYLVTDDGVFPADGYAPLYGKDWQIATFGEPNEPLNLASRHIRMTYVVDQVMTYLCVDHAISSVDAVYIDGELITDTSRYKYKPNLQCVSVTGLEEGQHITLFLTVEESEIDKARLMSCNETAVYGDYKDNILFFWDGNQKNTMFASCTVDDESLKEIRTVYKNTQPLYIPADSAFKMPKEEHQITAVCRQYDRLLIFTKDDTWMARLSSSLPRTLDAVTVNPSHGCTSVGAAVMCGNDPICVSDGTILRWTADTDELNECNAQSISSKIDSMLPSSFFKNAKILMNPKRSEIFFYDPTDKKGIVWIYKYDTNNWYKFDGIMATTMFSGDHRPGFVDSDTLYYFDETLGNDTLSDDTLRDIETFYESHPTDFSVSGNKKRLCGMTLNATLSGGSMNAEYISDGETISSVSLKSETSSPTSFVKRLNSRRFCYTGLRLSSKNNLPQRIYSTTIWAKP